MPIEAGDRYLPESHDMLDAFRVVNQRHFALPNSLERIKEFPYERYRYVAANYFNTAVAYLANRGHDEYMQEIGTTTWMTVKQGIVHTGLTNDMVRAAIQFGATPQFAKSMYSENSQPHVLITTQIEKSQEVEVAWILLPPDFLHSARTKPIEALAMMAWIGSQIRDFANGRMLIDPEQLRSRALATEAHLLHEARRCYPEIPLGPVYEKTMELYPEGINSLPPKVRYRGTAADAFKSAHLN